jgi:hypothetical protein
MLSRQCLRQQKRLLKCLKIAQHSVCFSQEFFVSLLWQFDQREGSRDGGALLLKAADRHYGLVAGLASCLRDERRAGKVDHSLRELVAQCVFSIACGYPDANDSARLFGDPIHKLLLDHDPIDGLDLASQPTLSRFENAAGIKELYRAGECLAESVIQRHAKRLRHRTYRVTIDLDPTDDPTHGAQQLSFFNGHYDTWCYLPVMGFISFNDEAEQYLCAAVLRPGNVTAAKGAVAILQRLVKMIRRHIPGVQIRVRLDGGFAHLAVFEFLDAQPKLEYVVAIGQECAVEAGRRTWNAASTPVVAAQWKDRTYLRRSPIQGRQVATAPPHHHQSRGCAGRRQGTQRQSPFRHHQHETESAVDL